MERSPGKTAGFIVLGAVVAALGALWLVRGRDVRPSAGRVAEANSSSSASPATPGSGGSPSFDRGAGSQAPESAAAGSPPAGQAAAPVERPLTEAEAQEAERISAEMGRMIRDLAYSPGVPEPPQNVVRRPPDPWRPDESRQGPSPVVESVEPRRGKVAGGDRVVLSGSHLRVVDVMFGQAAGTIVAATGSAITVVTPPSAAGTVAIAVTNDDGTWAIDEAGFTFVE